MQNNFKEQLINRYEYLYENASFILSPYMHEETEVEYYKRKINDSSRSLNKDNYLKYHLIYLKIDRLDNIYSLLEDFLLSDKDIKDTKLYKINEDNKNNSNYLKKVKDGLILLERKNNKDIKTILNIDTLLFKVGDYIEEQSGDLLNKKRKLAVLDEYFKLARYDNTGNIYYSGRKLSNKDVNYITTFINNNKKIRELDDVGVKYNNFIKGILKLPHYTYNDSIFSENEKQRIYLKYHEELPFDLEINCLLEEERMPLNIETRLIRPMNTKPCGNLFRIKEDNIFIDNNNSLYKYYQMCPHCGYIVNIPEEILSDTIKKRIDNRCSKDPMLFRKMFLYSELVSLEPSFKQKKLIKE